MKNNTVVTFVVALVAMIALVGCGPAGWSAKNVPDPSKLTPGQPVTVIQKDGSEISGTYLGTQDASSSEYFTQYNQTVAEKGLDELLPAIGDRVEVMTKLSDARVWTGELIGFDQDYLTLQPKGNGEPEKFYIASIVQLGHSTGTPIGRMQFRDMFVNGEIPLKSALILRNSSGDHSMPLNTIDKIVESATGTQVSVASLFVEPK